MKRRSVFIFAYYSFRDPVFQSAVLPYFRNFPAKEEYKFVLLTFEQSKYRLDSKERERIRTELLADNIIWYHSNWHSGKLKIFKKIYDTIAGLLFSLFLIVRHRCRVVYSEGFPGAVIAHYIAFITRRPHIVHTYEPHADYMVEGGVWDEGSWEARWLKKAEKMVGRKAYAVMTATNGFIEKLKSEGIDTRFIRVPSCVDADLFHFDEAWRQQVRADLKIREEQCVLVYIGKMGGMYWQEEIFEFFQSCLQTSSDFHFLFFSPDDPQKIKLYCNKYSLPEDKITFGFLRREQVPHYLSAADFGFVPVKQYPSKRYCSPIKDGEYWACELPVLIPEGISDDYLFTENNEIGMVIQPDKRSYTATAKKILDLYRDRDSYLAMRKRCRRFVLQDREIKSFQHLYDGVFNQLFDKP